MTKRELVKEVISKYSKDELLELTNSAPRTPLKVMKKKLLRLKTSELESLLGSQKLIYRLNIKALPIIALAALIMISVLTQGFRFPQAAADTNVGESASSTINVMVTYLTDMSCSECYDVNINSEILRGQFGLKLTESYVDAGSDEGQELINKYKITRYPTFILSSDAMDSELLSNVWASVGSVESDGALVFRVPELFETEGNYQLVLPDGTVTEVEYVPPVVNASIDDDSLLGNESAPVTIVMFSEFQCPFSGKFANEVFPELKTRFIDSGIVNIVFRDFPLGFHPLAHNISEAAECAHEQGFFWEFHDELFIEQESISETRFIELANNLGLNMIQFTDCYESGKYYDEVDNDLNDGLDYGVTGTPTFFINGHLIVGALPIEEFENVINYALSELNLTN